MTLGFFTVFRKDPQHFLHATSLVREARAVMPDVPVIQFTDRTTPEVDGVDAAIRLGDGPMLERRLEHYASCGDEWLFLDTDVSIRQDVRHVFDDPVFDVALPDRNWPHIPQGDHVMLTMPFNTGVVFTRSGQFWRDVLETWRGLPNRTDWLSEQQAVYQVVRTGRYRVKVLDGAIYNYPPKNASDPCDGVALAHYKGGARKLWLSALSVKTLSVCR